MGLFRKKKQLEITSAATKVYYSTPFGETKDGKQKLFLLGRDGMQYFAAFRSKESLKAFYERMDRAAYTVIEGDIQSVMAAIRSIELLKSVAIVIDPLSEHPVEIVPDSQP